MKLKILSLLIVALSIIGCKTAPEKTEMYIFLCLGQSNMEGHAPVEAQDSINIDARFQVLSTIDCPQSGRKKGHWYTAIPPLCRCNTGLTPVDYFGRTMVQHLPKNIKIGVINVAIGGCKIELFMKDSCQAYIAQAPDWMIGMIDAYDGDPYARLIKMAKTAQQDGVIKGILLHQGESNTNDSLWTQKVNIVYNAILNDLELDAQNTPLLSGELVNADQGGVCASMNNIIATLPDVIPNSYVISSAGCPCDSDNLHFTAEGYRMLGKRYATQMLQLLNNK